MPEEGVYAKRMALRYLRSRLNERAMAQIAGWAAEAVSAPHPDPLGGGAVSESSSSSGVGSAGGGGGGFGSVSGVDAGGDEAWVGTAAAGGVAASNSVLPINGYA